MKDREVVLEIVNHWKNRLTEIEIEPCRPPLWATGGHGQTLLGHFLPSPSPPDPGDPIDIHLPDGDRLVAHFTPGAADVVLYLFHGLGGSGEADYMKRQVMLARQRGYKVYAVNHRGCGAGRGLARGPYHSGRGDDMGEVIRFGRQRHPDHFHVGVGFSLSGNAMLLLASGVRGVVPPDLAVSVNAPIQLERSVIALKRGFSRLYDLRFNIRCRRDVRRRFRDGLLENCYDIPVLGTLHDFDDIYTAPEGGFKHREDYYATCSSARYLKQIDIPTVMLTSKDDPMVDYRDYLDADLSSKIHFHLEERGGHMGYLHRERTPLGTNRWLDYALDRYISASLEVLRGKAG